MRGMFWFGGAAVVLFVVLAGVLLPCPWKWGCVPPVTPGSTATPNPNTVQISLASSITKREWLEDAVKAFNEAAKSDGRYKLDGKPIQVTIIKEQDPLQPDVFNHYRSPTQVKDTLSGKIKPTILSPADEAWVQWLNKEWRAQHNGRDIMTEKPESVARTPVIIAMWQSRARALGCWPTAKPECSWQRLHELAVSPTGWGAAGYPEWGKLKVGYAHILESDVGAQTAVMLCMAGLQKRTGLTVNDALATNGCGKAISDVEKTKVRSGKSSPWLLEGLLKGEGYMDAVTTYEKEVIAYNRTNAQKMQEPLVAAYPQDGTTVAGHPFAIMDGAEWVTPEQVQAAKIFRQFLLSPEQQQALLRTGMRPADPNVRLASPIEPSFGANAEATVNAIEVPETLVLQQIQKVWGDVKKHAMIAVVFDKSGSMSGEKIIAASKGATEFVKLMHGQDTLVWMPFDDRVYMRTQGLQSEVGEQLVGEIGSTPASGGTALYDAVAKAYHLLEEKRKTFGTDVRYGIVVLSDGKDTNSTEMSLPQLEAMLRPSERDPHGIQIHTIGIGADADGDVLTKIATSAHGKYWKAKTTSVDEMIAIYREIAVYF